MILIDNLLNRITMYKTVLYGLIVLTAVSFIYSLTGFLFYSPVSLISSILILVSVCFSLNFLIARLLKVPANPESSVITAFILFFIMVPISSVNEIWIYFLAAVLAVTSKYILAINKKHIFNPAAFSLVILGILGLPQISWWVGNSYLFPFVLVVGLLVVRKVRKLTMFFVYFIFALVSISFFAQINGRVVSDTIINAVISYPLLFLGTVMLIEPLTTPPKKNSQLIYAGVVGIFSGAQFNLGPIYSSPELALLIGNIYSYFVSFRRRLSLNFIHKEELAPNIFEFVFAKNNNFNFSPGQYMEWTLGGFIPDLRGVRRFFTIASTPAEENIKIAVRIDNKRSRFKDKLSNLKKGDKIFANSLSGDFTLAKKPEKYIFIAGGIGITPFRSIVKNALEKNQKLDAVLFYSCALENEFIYNDLFDSAKSIGFRTIYICTNPTEKWKGIKGRINEKLLIQEVPDFKDRLFYLSGPNKMVYSFKKTLRKIGILPHRIVTDYFSGY